ncbi:MAG: extracellular solute-binding protein [Pseudomonadota bacterium]
MKKFLKTTCAIALVSAAMGGSAYAEGHAVDWSSELGNHDGVDLRIQLINDPFTKALGEIMGEFSDVTGANVSKDDLGYGGLYEKQVLNCSQRDDTYDVLFIDGIWVGEFAESGCIEAVEDRVNATDPKIIAMDDYVESFAGQATWNGTLQCLPIAGYWHMLHYRTDLFEQAGLEPPKTFDDMLAAAKVFKDNEDFPELEGGMAMNFQRGAAAGQQYFEWIYSAGGSPWKSNFIGSTDVYGDLAPTINSEEGVKMVEFFKEISQYGPPGVENFAWDERANAFTQGKVAMINNWSVRTPLFTDPDLSKVNGKFGVAMFPHAEGETSVPPVGGWILCINAHSKNKDAAWDFVKWFSSPETHKKFVLAGGPPSRHSAFQDEQINAEQFWTQTLYDSAKAAWPDGRPRYPGTFQVIDAIGLEVNRAIIGEEPVQEALDKANENVERVLKSEGLLR